jgi:hypothetical protein
MAAISSKSRRFLRIAIIACVYAGFKRILNLGYSFYSFSNLL